MAKHKWWKHKIIRQQNQIPTSTGIRYVGSVQGIRNASRDQANHGAMVYDTETSSAYLYTEDGWMYVGDATLG